MSAPDIRLDSRSRTALAWLLEPQEAITNPRSEGCN